MEKSPPPAASIREIVACLDGSDLGHGVVTHAHLVTRALGARLTLLHVLESEASVAKGSVPTDPLDWGIRRREARAHLNRVLARLPEPEREIRSEIVQGRPAEQICVFADRYDIDLTVLCSHGSHGLTEWDLSSTARKLIDKLEGSLLLVPGPVAARSEEVRYRRIIVPLDGSLRAETVIPIAARIAADQDAELLFVHVVPAPEIFRTGLLDSEGSDLERRVIQHNQRIATAYLDRLRARLSQSSARVRTLVSKDGSVRTKLEQLIREQRADLIVMSANGYTDPSESFCGSVSEFMLSHATVPVLVLRDRKSGRARRVDPGSARTDERMAPIDPAAS